MNRQRPFTPPSAYQGNIGAKIDVSSIKGNVSEQAKQMAYSLFKHFVSTPGKSYGAEIGQRLDLVEINIWGQGASSHAQTIFEMTVAKDMCNVYNTLHGACAAYIVDPCSVSSLVVLGIQHGFDGTGLSQSMNLIWHQAIQCGAQIKIVSTATYTRGRVRSMRCEIWDKDANALCISALHSTVNATTKSGQTSGHAKL